MMKKLFFILFLFYHVVSYGQVPVLYSAGIPDSIYLYRNPTLDSVSIVLIRGKDTSNKVKFKDYTSETAGFIPVGGAFQDLEDNLKIGSTTWTVARGNHTHNIYKEKSDTTAGTGYLPRWQFDNHTHSAYKEKTDSTAGTGYARNWQIGNHSHSGYLGNYGSQTINGNPSDPGGLTVRNYIEGQNGTSTLYAPGQIVDNAGGSVVMDWDADGLKLYSGGINGALIYSGYGGYSSNYYLGINGVISRSGYLSGSVLWSGDSYSDLSTSGKIGTGSSQVAAGNHSHSSLSCSGSVNGFTITSTYEGASTTYKFDPFGAISWSGYGTGTVLPAGGAYNDIIGTGLTLHGQCGSGYSNYFAMGDHTHAGLGGTVYEITAGAGMSFSTINYSGSIAMGTPSTITAYTSNSASGTTHTHAISGFQEAFTVNSPLMYSSPTLSIGQASISGSGYLSSTDWNTFNNKANKSSVSMTITVITDMLNKYFEGEYYGCQWKYRTITITNGVITDVSAESDWQQ